MRVTSRDATWRVPLAEGGQGERLTLGMSHGHPVTTAPFVKVGESRPLIRWVMSGKHILGPLLLTQMSIGRVTVP